MTGSPLADLFMDCCEFNGPRDTLVPRLPDMAVPLGTGSIPAVGSAVCPSLDSVSSFAVLSPFFLA